MTKVEINHHEYGVIDLPQAQEAAARNAKAYPDSFVLSEHLSRFLEAALDPDVHTYYVVSPRRAYVFHRDQPFVSIGMLSYEDARTRGAGDKPTYNVRALSIRNDKYQSGTPNHRTKMTASIRSAVKTAHAHLKPFSMHDLFKFTRMTFQTALREADSVARGEVDTAWRALAGTYRMPGSRLEQLVLELASRADAATLPKGEEMLAFKASMDAYEQPHMDMPDLRFVHARRGQYWVHDIEYHRKTYNNLTISGDPAVYDEATVPPFIMDRLAVLQIIDPGQAVPGVGLRLHESLALVSV